nr:hypothetical protein [Enterococcus innesii]
MNKIWLASLTNNLFYKARQLQAISYASLALNVILTITLFWIMGVK